MANYTYAWCWIDGEDDQYGDSWIQIGPIEDDGAMVDEMATIMCRNYAEVKRVKPEWIQAKENDATLICNALNFYAENAEYVAERG